MNNFREIFFFRAKELIEVSNDSTQEIKMLLKRNPNKLSSEEFNLIQTQYEQLNTKIHLSKVAVTRRQKQRTTKMTERVSHQSVKPTKQYLHTGT